MGSGSKKRSGGKAKMKTAVASDSKTAAEPAPAAPAAPSAAAGAGAGAGAKFAKAATSTPYPSPDSKEMQELLADYDVNSNPFYEECYSVSWFTAIRTVLQGIILVPPKLILVALFYLSVWAVCSIMSFSWTKRKYIDHEGRFEPPLAPWRVSICRNACWLGVRALLMVAGIWWVDIRRHKSLDPAATTAGAKIVDVAHPKIAVANHIGWMDSLTLYYLTKARVIAKAELKHAPVLGTILKATGMVLVSRKSDTSRHLVGELVATTALKVNDGSTPPFGLFPEGTTTNGRGIIQFRAGAFRSGAPVQAYVMTTPFRWFCPAWTAQPILWHIARTLCQVYVNMTIHVLPPMAPPGFKGPSTPDGEAAAAVNFTQDDAIAFSNGVKHAMCTTGGLHQFNNTFRQGVVYSDTFQPRIRFPGCCGLRPAPQAKATAKAKTA